MSGINYASFALDIPILLPALGAFTVALASRRWFGLKLSLWVGLSAYMAVVGQTLYGRAVGDQSWHRDLIFGFGLAAIALWIFVLPAFWAVSPHPLRKRILWTLNSYVVSLFYALSGSLSLGYLDVPDLFPEPIKSMLFSAGTPDWLRGPHFMWASGSEWRPVRIFFLVSIALLIAGYNWLWSYRDREPKSTIAVILVGFLRLKPWQMLMLLLPIVAVFFSQLHTAWMQAVLFALYPVSLVSLGVMRIGYTIFGSYERETGFFGNLENYVDRTA